MNTEDYIKAYKDDRVPLTSEDIVAGLTSMQAESDELVVKKDFNSKYTLKHLASILAEEKMKTMSSDEMKAILNMRRKISFKASDPAELEQKLSQQTS